MIAGSEAEDGAGAIAAPATVRVWDPAVRIFHWSLVISFAIAFVSADEWDRLHEQVGYVAAALVAFRVLWGFVGSRYARFTSFVTGPRKVLAYVGDVATGREKRYLGHNPAGGAMVIMLLLGILGLAATGYMLTLDRFWAAKWIEEVHEAIANGMLLLVALHVGGVIFTGLRHGENLVAAMLTGRKRVDVD